MSIVLLDDFEMACELWLAFCSFIRTTDLVPSVVIVMSIDSMLSFRYPNQGIAQTFLPDVADVRLFSAQALELTTISCAWLKLHS